MWDDRQNQRDQRDRGDRHEESSVWDEATPNYRDHQSRMADPPHRDLRQRQEPEEQPPRSPLVVNEPRQQPRRGPVSDSPDTWRAAASVGMLVGIVLIVLSLILALFSFWQLLSADGGARIIWGIFLVAALGVGAMCAYLLRGLTTIRYVLGQDRLIVRWMREELTVHFAEIVDTTYDPRSPVRLPGWEPIWPGYYVSIKRTPAGVWRSFATEEPRRRVRITTTRGIIAISPARPVRFIVELDRRRASPGLGPSPFADDTRSPMPDGIDSHPPVTRPEPYDPFPARTPPPPQAAHPSREHVHPEVVYASDDAYVREPVESDQPAVPSRDHLGPPASSPPAPPRRTIVRPDEQHQQNERQPEAVRYVYDQLFRTELLGDRVASNLIAVGVALPLLMAAYLFSQFEGVPDPVPLHWDAAGDVDRVGQPSALWLLPIMGVVVLVVNTFAATLLMAVDRFLSRLILMAVPIVQIVAFIALVRLVTI